jgi:hypothetical protein
LTALVGVKSSEIDTYWVLVEPLITKGLLRFRTRRFEASDILIGAREGRFQVWLALAPNTVRAVAVTEVRSTPHAKICHVFFTAGEGRKSWMEHFETLQKWAVSIECTDFTAECRPGWQRDPAFKDFTPSKIIMEKRLWTVPSLQANRP